MIEIKGNTVTNHGPIKSLTWGKRKIFLKKRLWRKKLDRRK